MVALRRLGIGLGCLHERRPAARAAAVGSTCDCWVRACGILQRVHYHYFEFKLRSRLNTEQVGTYSSCCKKCVKKMSDASQNLLF